MKSRIQFALLLLCVVLSQAAQSQLQRAVREKPAYFREFPEQTEFAQKSLKKLFNHEVGETISIPIIGKTSFVGKVTEKVKHSNNLTTINIISSNFPGTLLNLSLVTDEHQKESFTGMMINPEKGDVIIITKENDKYYLTKQPQKFFITE